MPTFMASENLRDFPQLSCLGLTTVLPTHLSVVRFLSAPQRTLGLGQEQGFAYAH